MAEDPLCLRARVDLPAPGFWTLVSRMERRDLCSLEHSVYGIEPQTPGAGVTLGQH